MTLSEAARSVGAVCLCGAEEAMEKRLPLMVLGDGSPEQFARTVRRSGSRVLCVVGDRKELQRAAVELGCDLLLTGGAEPERKLLTRAESRGLSVFVSEQDSSTLLGMLSRRLSDELPLREMSQVRDWMQLPRYLYHDDMVTEWHRLYSDIFYEGSSCAVVDDRTGFGIACKRWGIPADGAPNPATIAAPAMAAQAQPSPWSRPVSPPFSSEAGSTVHGIWNTVPMLTLTALL